jgi:phosphoglycerol transferase MdoB-like AlkP superfamily enzyme
LDRFQAARAYVNRAAIASLLAGLAIHLRILLTAPVISSQPVMWLILATLQSLAEVATVAAVLNLIVVPLSPRTARLLATVVAVVRVIAQAGLAEVTIFFGHGLFRENLQTALHPTLFAGSLHGHTLASIVSFTVVLSILLVAAHFSARRYPRTRSNAFLCTVALLAIIGANILPPVHLDETTSNPMWTVVRLLNHDAINQARGAVVVPPPKGKPTDIRLLMPKRHDRFLSDDYPLAYLPPERTPTAPRLRERPNIVFWIIEGLRPEEVGAYGGVIPNLTPNFDSLVPRSIFFQNAYSDGSFTPEGELAMWYGLQASPYEILVRTRPNVKLYGLPEILAKDGYRLLWMHPSDAEMYLSTRFYLTRGFRVIDGRDFNPSLASTNWGYSDRALAQTLVAAVDRMPQPFAAMGVTVSNHHPFQVPDDARTRINLPAIRPKHGYRDLFPGFQEGEHTLPRLHSVHYADEALGYFMSLARSKPWFKNTIFVIAGDHGAPTKPYGREIENIHDYLELRHSVAMLMYSPLLAPRVIKEPVSHADLLPTLLGLIGDQGPRAGLGIDLLDPAEADDKRMIVAWNDSHALLMHDAHFSYHAILRADGDRYDIATEALYDVADKRGRNDLAAAHRADVERFHRAGAAYLDTYGWLVASGHSGLPPRADR